MDQRDVVALTWDMSPENRVRFWGTFESRPGFPSPAALTHNSADDVAAVVAGSKPATLFDTPQSMRTPDCFPLLTMPPNDDSTQLIMRSVTGGYGMEYTFFGRPENVETLLKLYRGRKKGDSAFHRAVGEALGYSADAIDEFVGRVDRPSWALRLIGRLLTRH